MSHHSSASISTLDLNSDGSADYSATTELDGTYEIIVRLNAAQIAHANRTFSIRQDLSFSPGWEQSTDNLGLMQILSGLNSLNNDFGNFQRGAIRGQVFEDRLANGIDDNDPPLGDVKIQLDRLANPDGSGAERQTRTSSADQGEYEFTNLRPGRYLVTQSPIAGAVQTTTNPEVIELISGRVYLPALTHPQGSPGPLEVRVPELAFGDFYLGSIHGFAFHDNNGNGTDEVGDGRRAGAVITLEVDADSDGLFERTERATTADVTGVYSFTQLGPGKYRVTEAAPADALPTTEAPDVITLRSHDVYVGLAGQVTLDPKQTERINRKLRFGAFETVELSGVKFEDRNGDGAKTNDEPLLAGWTIQLDFDSNGTIDQTAVTDQSGRYEFANVGPGRHTVGERTKGNWDQTFPATPGIHIVTTESGKDVGDLDFGNRRSPECDGFIFGATYDDLDRDSFRDLDDPGLPQQTVFVDLNNNGVLDSSRNYRSTGGAKIIPDAVGEAPGVLSSTRRVCGIVDVVTDLNVSINIEHDRDSDLEILLRSPEGTVIQLVEHVGGSGQNFANTVFNDEAATAVNGGTAPFTGSFRPQQPLSTFDGESSSGLWTLEIRDSEADQGGRLLGWSLTFAGVREPFQVTSEIGNFRISDLGADTYHVRHILTNGRIATTDNPLDVRLSTGEEQSIVFGSFQETPAWQNTTENRDVNADGFIVPLDALLVINEINEREISAAATGRLPQRTSDASSLFDVNGDDFASALDALIIINFLNGAGEGEFHVTMPSAADAWISHKPPASPKTNLTPREKLEPVVTLRLDSPAPGRRESYQARDLLLTNEHELAEVLAFIDRSDRHTRRKPKRFA